MRLLVVSTPRSGNMWARRLLRGLFALEERSAHRAEDLDWDALPERCVVQLHADRTPALEALLALHGFRTVVLARHPLDVLVSILHFARHEPQTAEWLQGRHGDERSILEADPTSRAFVRYATGRRAGALLAVTPQWWEAADVHIRYEDLVSAAPAQLHRLAAELDEEPRVPVEELLGGVSFGALREEASNLHFWRGRPDGWRLLLTARVTRRIERAHRPVFEALAYEVEPDPALDARAARALWATIAVPPAAAA